MSVNALPNRMLLAFGIVLAGCENKNPEPAQIAGGADLYAQHCASCHGAQLEGQPNWRQRLPNGRLPAPPHDESGHTWHHPDEVLFAITKYGMVPPNAPPGYESDMPAFRGKLSDDVVGEVLKVLDERFARKVECGDGPSEIERTDVDWGLLPGEPGELKRGVVPLCRGLLCLAGALGHRLGRHFARCWRS